MTVFAIWNQSQLDAALVNMAGGDTLQLAAGDYKLTLSNKAIASEIIITSLDPSTPAKLTEIDLLHVSNLTFRNIDIGRPIVAPDTTGTALSKIWGGSNLVFDTVHFYGSMDGDPRNDGTGINVGNVNGMTITNSEFEQLGRGVVFGTSNNLTITNNKFHDIRSDGLDFAAVRNVVIDGNSFTNFRRVSSDHPDAIQFWTTNTTTPSTDIVIRNNVILQGTGDGMQGIFMRDELGTLPYERVTIENNFIYEQNMSNGITVMGGRDIIIRGNTVLSPSDDNVPVWIRLEDIVGGTITKNLTDRFYTGSNTNVGLSITDNKLTANAGFPASQMTFAKLRTMTSPQFFLNGYGYNGPSSGSGGITPTLPVRIPRKGMLVTKTAVSQSYHGLSAFSTRTLADTLPELQPGGGSTGTLAPFRSKSAATTVVRRIPRTSAADKLVSPAATAYQDYRFTLFSGS